MNINTLDIFLLNIMSFCGGVLFTFTFVFCCETRRFNNIARQTTIKTPQVDNAKGISS